MAKNVDCDVLCRMDSVELFLSESYNGIARQLRIEAAKSGQHFKRRAACNGEVANIQATPTVVASRSLPTKEEAYHQVFFSLVRIERP